MTEDLAGTERRGRTRLLRSGPVTHLVLDNPGARNALTASMYEELEAACHQLAEDPALRLVVVRGEGGAFAAGTDVRDLLEVRSGSDGVVYEAMITRVLDALRALDVMVVALVDGPAVGGGLAILACCDLVYATADARFGAPVARTLGNCVSPGTTARLRSLIGRAATTELLLTGRLMSASEAHSAGLVRSLVSAAEFDSVVDDLLAQVSRCAPLSVAAAKEFGRRLDDQLAAVESADVYDHVYGSADFHEGVDAFLAHRSPVWSGG